MDQNIRICDVCGQKRVNYYPGKTVDKPKMASMELSFWEWDEKDPYTFDVCENCLPNVKAEFEEMLDEIGIAWKPDQD